ncbi:phage tail protein [Pokkaliibacter sp. CJK22405]|uniref:phage tail protein n=1 Tax=Pokkaliibacter sp. CJK22405 TaxID=3384615 RepID=UPI0039854E61
MDTLPDIPHDYGTPIEVAFAIDETSFGDGYTESRPKGLNSVKDSITLNWTLLERDEWNAVFEFLHARKGVTPFLFKPEWEDTPRQWRCKTLTGQRPTSFNRGSISAQFEEYFG